MTTNSRSGNPRNSPPDPLEQEDEATPLEVDLAGNVLVALDMVEALLRHVVSLRAANAVDDQLAQLVRMVDSATWSAPVPMTVLVDGALLRGVLVPSEVNATYVDDALVRSAHVAVSQLETGVGESDVDPGSESDLGQKEMLLQQARAFLHRIRRRPFSAAQARIRQRNANALMALDRWHQTREQSVPLTPLDIPGTYTDPGSAARDVIPYAAGQRAMTLADVKVLIAGEWVAIPAPFRVTLARVGAWAVDQ